MAASTVMTIQVRSEVKEKLDRLAADTRRSASSVAEEALAAYVDREFLIIDGIRRGLDDVEAERLVSHAEAVAELRSVIEAARGGGA